MSDILSDLQKLINSVKSISELDGQTLKASDSFGQNIKQNMQLPLRQRLRDSGEEATNLFRAQMAEKGEVVNEPGELTADQLQKMEDGIVDQLIYDKLMRMFQ